MSLEAESIKLNYVLSEACILSDREIECLALASLGYTNGKIGEIIMISEGMAKKNLADVFNKFSVKDRTSAVTIAFIHNILNITVLNEIIVKYNLDPPCLKRLG